MRCQSVAVGYLLPICLCCIAAMSGCTSLSDTVRAAGSGLNSATTSVVQRWRRVTGSNQRDRIVEWDWTTGVPVDTPRGELLAATLPGDAVAHFIPNLTPSPVRLVSAPGKLAGYEIRNIEGRLVENCSDVHAAIQQIPASATDVQVDLAPIGARRNSAESAHKLDRSTLIALTHAIAPATSTFRVAEGGNPTLVIRDGSVRANVVLRVERNIGLAQLVVTLANCHGKDLLLPVEVRVQCADEPLKCLTVANALELLYGEPGADLGKVSASFAETSEREDYLLPVNYKRLRQRDDDRRGLARQSPAFASLAGMRYPGPALLGDARALTGIMLQQQILERGEQAQTGWILFHGKQLRSAEQVDVTLDLGNKPKSYRFMLPKTK